MEAKRIEGYLTWAANFDKKDLPAIYVALGQLDYIRQLLAEGATNEQVSSAILELD